ncbi:MAG: DNA double-strand break repair nuclease NurA [Candidatus Thorarchaeota archaeon]|nr:DNA double-strand break repair nuclease NurA [Candidatus Thorarchaeota archaeon]
MHRNLDRVLSQLVEEIERVEVTRRRFGAVMKKIKGQIDPARFAVMAATTPESRLVSRVQPTSLSGLRIAGIDGGLVRRDFGGMELILTRGVAVILQFQPQNGPDVEFFPDPFPEPRVQAVRQPLSSTEMDQLASLQRLEAELGVTLAVLDEFDADIILVDGSLMYHPRDRPPSASPVNEKFQEVMALYRQLYHRSKKKKATLVGVVKDSRSSRVVSMLGDILPHMLREPSMFELMQGVDYRWLLRFSRDCDILNTFLEEGERTFIFNYSAEFTQTSNSLDDDLLAWASDIWVTYLKTARDDLPIRVEVLATQGDTCTERVDRALSAILPLSWGHPEYGIPTPILEADARAKITNNESQLVVDRLAALSGLSHALLEKRRSRNPFGG